MNLPVGWRNVAIKDVAANEQHAFIDGDWIEAPFITTTGIRLIQTGNIGIGTFVNRNKKYISQKSFDELKCKDVKVGDILICRLADPIGRSCVVPDLHGRAITSVDVCILRVEDSEYDRDFIAHALNQPTFLAACQEKSGGSTRQRISRKNLGTIDILAAEDKLEQAKIAEVLSTVDRTIEQTEALITKQQRIKTGLMQHLLTRGIDEHGNLRSEQTHKFKDSPLGRIPVEWDAIPLSEAVDLRVGYAFKRAWFADEGMRLLRGENVGTGSADWKDTQWLPSEIADRHPECMLAEGDIVIGMDRTFTKQGCKVTILCEADVPCLLVQRVGCFMPVRISSDYMQIVVQSPQYQRELLLQQKGMDIPHLSKGEILSPLIPIPKTVEEMESIAACVKKLQTALTNESTHLNKLRSIKTGLMQDLLTGDRRVTALLRSPKEMVGA